MWETWSSSSFAVARGTLHHVRWGVGPAFVVRTGGTDCGLLLEDGQKDVCLGKDYYVVNKLQIWSRGANSVDATRRLFNDSLGQLLALVIACALKISLEKLVRVKVCRDASARCGIKSPKPSYRCIISSDIGPGHFRHPSRAWGVEAFSRDRGRGDPGLQGSAGHQTRSLTRALACGTLDRELLSARGRGEIEPHWTQVPEVMAMSTISRLGCSFQMRLSRLCLFITTKYCVISKWYAHGIVPQMRTIAPEGKPNVQKNHTATEKNRSGLVNAKAVVRVWGSAAVVLLTTLGYIHSSLAPGQKQKGLTRERQAEARKMG